MTSAEDAHISVTPREMLLSAPSGCMVRFRAKLLSLSLSNTRDVLVMNTGTLVGLAGRTRKVKAAAPKRADLEQTSVHGELWVSWGRKAWNG